MMFDGVYLLIHELFRGDARNAAAMIQRLPRWFVRRLARARLLHLLRYVWGHSPLQRERWRREGIRRRDLRSDRVLRSIPFTTSKDLTVHGEDYVCVPDEELIHVIGTSGTSGQIKKLFTTARDMENQTRLFGSKLCQLPGASRVLAIFIVDTPTWSAGMFARRGIETSGKFGLLAGSECETSYLLELIREYRIDTVITTPTTMHRMTLEAACDLRGLGLRYAILTAQPWTEKLRDEIERAWGVVTIDAYGTNELGGSIAAECPHRNGLHISDIDFWVEIVDPETGKPLDDGEEGEIVVSTLNRRGMPLVRYRTGDLAHLIPYDGRCACGAPLSKLSRVRGRIDDMLILGPGTNVYPDEFDRAILAVPGISDYQIVVEKDAYKDVLSLTVETDRPIEEMRESLLCALMTIHYVKDACEKSGTLVFKDMRVVPRGTLSAGRSKSVRIVDERPS